jgi:hypothetical protein
MQDKRPMQALTDVAWVAAIKASSTSIDGKW